MATITKQSKIELVLAAALKHITQVTFLVLKTLHLFQRLLLSPYLLVKV